MQFKALNARGMTMSRLEMTARSVTGHGGTMRSRGGDGQGGRYEGAGRSPFGIGGAIAVHAVVLGVWLLVPREMIAPYVPTTLIGTNIPLTPPPPEEKRAAPEQKRPTSRPSATKSEAPDPFVLPPVKDDTFSGTDQSGQGGNSTGDTIAPPLDPPPPIPVLTEASVDPRAMAGFQPDYPGSMLRQNVEGSVTVRVTIGADGRVADIERVSATDDAFWIATQKQALRKWRFRPATRDGLAVSSIRVMTVHFRLTGR